MTDLLTTDTYDSGEIVRLDPAIAETAVLERGQITQAIRPYDVYYPGLRRSDATGDPAQTVVFALSTDETVVLALQDPPVGDPPPLPPIPPTPGRHALSERVGEYPIVRPAVPLAGRRRPRHQRGRLIAYGVWTGIGSLLLFEAAVTLGAWLVLR
jgi:hypothetical protein